MEEGEGMTGSDYEDKYLRNVEARNDLEIANHNLDVMMVNIYGSMKTLVTELCRTNTNACTLRSHLEGTEVVTRKQTSKCSHI